MHSLALFSVVRGEKENASSCFLVCPIQWARDLIGMQLTKLLHTKKLAIAKKNNNDATHSKQTE